MVRCEGLGYFSSGGSSLAVVVSVTLLVSPSIYGSDGNFNLSG